MGRTLAGDPRTAVAGSDLLPVFKRDAPGQVWVVGAHGGAGVSTIVAADPGRLRSSDRSWPGPDQVCVLVAKTSAAALLAAQAALAQWSSDDQLGNLLGLILVADAPGRLRPPLKHLADVVAGGAPKCWHVGWSETIRVGEADPGLLLPVIRDLRQLTERASNGAGTRPGQVSAWALEPAEDATNITAPTAPADGITDTTTAVAEDWQRDDEPAMASGRRNHRVWALAAGALILVCGAGAWGMTVVTEPAAITAEARAEAPADGRVAPGMFQGGVLPVSESDGPHRLTDIEAAGYTQTPLGAAIAAAQLSARLSPSTGPAVFETVIDNQMVGDQGLIKSYRESVTAAYRAAAQRAGVTGGGAILTPRASITAWRIDQEHLAGDVPVQLASSSPGGETAIWTIHMRWSQGDWRVVVPSGTTAWTRTTTDNTTGFMQFYEENR